LAITSNIAHRSRRVAQPDDAIDARLPPLPVGRLSAQTLRNIGIGRMTFFRTGPWVVLVEDGSRVVRVDDGSEPSLFADPPRAEPAPAPRPPEPELEPAESLFGESAEPRPARASGRAVVLNTPPRRESGARAHRPRTRRRPERT
jgi:hypothetical protein